MMRKQTWRKPQPSGKPLITSVLPVRRQGGKMVRFKVETELTLDEIPLWASFLAKVQDSRDPFSIGTGPGGMTGAVDRLAAKALPFDEPTPAEVATEAPGARFERATRAADAQQVIDEAGYPTAEEARVAFKVYAGNKSTEDCVAILKKFEAVRVGDIPVTRRQEFIDSLKEAEDE